MLEGFLFVVVVFFLRFFFLYCDMYGYFWIIFFFHKAGIRVICFKVFMCSLIYSFINIYHFPVFLNYFPVVVFFLK